MNKEILKLAIPNILSNISVPLLSAVDVALMGNLSMLHLGAIGLATMIFNFFFWNFGFLRMGTTGLVAQAFGNDNKHRVNQLFSQGIYLALIISLIILIFQNSIGHFAQRALSISHGHTALVWHYFEIRIWSAPATLVMYCLLGWLFGIQNSVLPLIFTVVINILNIGLSYYLVVIVGWEMKGVALGTLIAEYLGAIFLFITIRLKYGVKLVKPDKLTHWARFVTVNRDLFIRTVALTTAFAFFYRQSAQSGPLTLATNVVLLQFLGWMSYAVDGFSFASESLVGKYVGKGNLDKVYHTIYLSFLWGLTFAILFSASFGIWLVQIGSLFTSSQEILSNLINYRLWLVALPILAFICYIWDGIFIGLTNTDKMRDSMLISLAIYLVTFYVLQSDFINAIWISFAIFLTIRGIILSFYWIEIKAQLKKRLAHKPLIQ